MGLTLALALGAAVLFAAGTVYQEKVATTASDTEAASAGFLIRLAKQPVWLLGIAIDAGGVVCQAAALGVGKLVVVQPILAPRGVFAPHLAPERGLPPPGGAPDPRPAQPPPRARRGARRDRRPRPVPRHRQP